MPVEETAPGSIRELAGLMCRCVVLRCSGASDASSGMAVAEIGTESSSRIGVGRLVDGRVGAGQDQR